ncbi:MAG: flagellar hook-length control protein FliK [Pseudomonadota bacterium]
MQNLPIQFTQTPPVKNGGADAVSKIDPVSPASNQSFQNMLSKQVQLKQANTRQPVQPPAQQKPAVQSKPVPQPAAPSNTDAAAQKSKADSKAAEQAKDAEGKPAVADTAEIRSKIASDVDALSAKALGKEKESELSPEGAASAVVDPALAGQLGVPVPVVNTAVGGTPVQTDADAATQKVASPLDTALNNALSQGKGTAADGAVKLEDGSPDMKNAKDNTKAENSKLGADNSRWLDSVMANAAKSANADESANTKLAAATAKDFAVKDIAPVPAYQPVAAANAMQAAQQIGSANVINAMPGKTGWDEAISQKVIWMAGSGEQSASLTLNPPDMGPLQVVIHVHNDQADTTFISDNPEVRQALENGLSTLREKMGEAGIQLGQANISSGGQAQQEFQRATQNRTGAQPGQAGDGKNGGGGDPFRWR